MTLEIIQKFLKRKREKIVYDEYYPAQQELDEAGGLWGGDGMPTTSEAQEHLGKAKTRLDLIDELRKEINKIISQSHS